MLRTLALTLIPWLLCAGAAAADAPNYAVKFDGNTQNVTVKLCPTRAHTRIAFAADSAWAMRFVHDLAREQPGTVESADGQWIAADWRDDECLHYRVDLGAIAQLHQPDVGWRLGEDLVTAPQLWLLRVVDEDTAAAMVRIELPPDWSISAPWRELSRSGNSVVFNIPGTPPDWSAAVAIGKFREQPITLPGGMLRVSILHGANASQQAALMIWLARVAHAALSAYGRLPLPDVQVLVLPAEGHDEAVLFGQSTRGQGNALNLLVDPSKTAAEFADDWMAVHELSHLMHPYLGDRGSWLAEGLATYYQNTLRARAGMLTPAQAWDRLAQGFRRGTAQTSDDALEDIAANMHRTHAFQRVYWAGAAYWLTVDRDLRAMSSGKLSVELALARFRDCCLPAYGEWQAADFVTRLDALLGTEVFAARYREFASMRQFPDWKKLYADLGIDGSGEHLRFDNAARDAAIRDAITAPPREH